MTTRPRWSDEVAGGGERFAAAGRGRSHSRIALAAGALLAASAQLAPGPLGPVPLAALQTRDELVEQARNELDPEARLNLLGRAADPGLAPPDSMWAVAIFDLAQTLIGLDEGAAASVWLSWIARHGEQWPLDRTFYSPGMVEMYDRTLEAVEGDVGPEADQIYTSWQWPGTLNRNIDGSVQIRAVAPEISLEVRVEGEAPLQAGGSATLPPGSYEFVATAQGHDEVRATREVLPGVTTSLEFNPVPVLGDDIESRVARGLAVIRYAEAGGQVCIPGVVADPGDLVVTSNSVLGRTTGIEVVTWTGSESGRSVVERDAGLDLAVLRLQGQVEGTLPLASGVRPRQHVWAAYRPGCGDLILARTHLVEWGSGAQVPIAPGLPDAARGAPVVDRLGSVVGVVRGPAQIAPLAAAGQLLAQARQGPPGPGPTTTVETGAQDSGGTPWLWIGAGAVAAGAAAAVLLGSGGNGQATTGGLIITVPGG